MEVLKKTFNCTSQTQTFKVSFLGDWHLGAASCDEKYIQNAILTIALDPDHYVVGMGDYGEFIHTRDKRYNEEVISKEVLASNNLFEWQVNRAVRYFKPVKERLLYLLTGNHALTAKKFYYTNPVNRIASLLGTESPGYSAFIRLTFKLGKATRLITIFTHHGVGGGRKIGGKVNKVVEFALDHKADIYAMGHVHEAHTHIIPLMDTTAFSNRLVGKNRFFLLTGSALKAYLPEGQKGVTYVERAAYHPVAIGHVEVRITPFVGKHKEPRIEAVEILG